MGWGACARPRKGPFGPREIARHAGEAKKGGKGRYLERGRVTGGAGVSPATKEGFNLPSERARRLGIRFAQLGRFPMGRAHPQGAVMLSK